MTRTSAGFFCRAMLLLSLIGLPSAVLGDAGHDAKKEPAATQGMDHGDAAAAHWMAPEEAARRPNPVAADRESLERGSKLFKTNCASCHGPGGRGDGPAGAALDPKPADLTAMAGQHPDGDFAWKIANGRGPMPAWNGRLSEKNLWDLVNFIQSLARPQDGPRH